MAEQKQLERVYIIPLRKEFQKAPHYKRSKKAISAIRDFIKRHMKPEEIKIGENLNLKVWERGIRNPPHKVKVTCTKNEKGIVTVELFGFPKEEEKKAVKEQHETKAEKPETEIQKAGKEAEMSAKEIQKEEIKELQREHPKIHKPKESAVIKETHLRKKVLIPPKTS